MPTTFSSHFPRSLAEFTSIFDAQPQVVLKNKPGVLDAASAFLYNVIKKEVFLWHLVI